MLDRWGKQLRKQAYIHWQDVKEIDIEKYFQRFKQDRKSKKVFLVDDASWTENYLMDWLKENYGTLGFDEVFEEHTPQYNELKRKMGFTGFPDFLIRIGDQILRLEIECFSSLYNHSADYCEIVLCYEINHPLKDVRLIGLKEQLGYEDIINKAEVLEYMHLKYDDFRQDCQNKAVEEWSKKTE